MQGVNVSCVGQTTSLLRCSASKENKSRTRLTKEERRKMATSFIKKYQSSNNGKFPSLNLTHKEVGGSFYTVREIVREIIQENKVLGPGNPSSKLLNLEYCSEDGVDKGSLVDVHGNMSISTIGHGMDHYEVDSLVKEGKGSSEENTAIVKPFFQEDLSNGMVLHEKLVNTLKKSDVHTSTLKKDGISGSAEHVNDEVQLNSSEDIDIQYVAQSVLLDHSAPGTSLVGSEVKNEDSKNKISGETQLFEGSTNISDTAVTESSPGTIMSFSNTVNDQIQWVDICNSFADAIKDSKICSSKLLEPNIQETNHSEVQAKKQSDAFCTANVGGLVSSLNEMATKESEKAEMNPMWAAIKSFISYFIKFWSE